MAVGKEQYVYRLMKAKCSCGSKDFSQFLNVKTDHGVVFNDKEYPLMNANDHVSGENIYSFGRCKSICNPDARSMGSVLLGPVLGWVGAITIGCKCQPLTPFPWVQVDEDYYIDGAPALTINSVLHCANGGEITITLEAQEQQTEEATEEIPQEEQDKKAQLPSEVQEKIDSFTGDTERGDLSARGTEELLKGDETLVSPENITTTPEMFERYNVDVTDIQINGNYIE